MAFPRPAPSPTSTSGRRSCPPFSRTTRRGRYSTPSPSSRRGPGQPAPSSIRTPFRRSERSRWTCGRSVSTSSRSPPTSSAARRAPAPSSCGRASACSPSPPAAGRNGGGGAGPASGVDLRVRDAEEKAGLEPVAQAGEARRLGRKVRRREPDGRAETDDGRYVLGPAPPPPFLPAAGGEGLHADALPHEEGAGARRAAELVGGEREEVDTERPHVHRDLSDRLNGVRMDDGAGCPGPRRELGEGVEYRPRLVVREKGGHERRPLVEVGEGAGRGNAIGVHAKLDGLETVRVERERRLPNGRVLSRGEGHARARWIGLACGAGASADGEVVGLGASGREHDFRRLRA